MVFFGRMINFEWMWCVDCGKKGSFCKVFSRCRVFFFNIFGFLIFVYCLKIVKVIGIGFKLVFK